jgi:hypothetical protein
VIGLELLENTNLMAGLEEHGVSSRCEDKHTALSIRVTAYHPYSYQP